MLYIHATICFKGGESVKKDILTIQHIKSDLRKLLLGHGIAAAICIVLFLLYLKVFLEVAGSVMETLFTKLRVAILPTLWLILAIYCIKSIFALCSVLNKPGRIVTDRVVGMETKDHIRWGIVKSCDQTYHLRFASYGEYVIPGTNHSWSDLHAMSADMVYFHAECDDEFYLVLSKPYTGKILLAYPTKMFDYQPPQAGG